MRNRRNIYILLGIIALIVIMMFLCFSTFVQPKITFTAEINKISDEDYKRIMNNKQGISPDNGIEKFRHIDLKIKVISPPGIINHANIGNIPSQQFLLQQYLKDNNKITILGGGCFSMGNGTEYSENVEIYLKGISDDELRTIVENFRIVVLWENIWNKKDSKIFYLKDYLK